MDARFWAAIGFVVLCLLAAAVVVLFGPRIWPRTPAHPPPAATNPLPLRPVPR